MLPAPLLRNGERGRCDEQDELAIAAEHVAQRLLLVADVRVPLGVPALGRRVVAPVSAPRALCLEILLGAGELCDRRVLPIGSDDEPRAQRLGAARRADDDT